MKKLIKKIIEAANIIENNNKPKACYIPLNNEYIQALADKKNISFDEATILIQNYFDPIKDNELFDLKTYPSFKDATLKTNLK